MENKSGQIRVKNGFKVKVVDFDKMEKKDPDFKHAVGVYTPEEKTAYISKELPIVNKGTRKGCEGHELVHHRLAPIEDDIRFIFPTPKLEESYVELEGIVRTQNRFLSYGEVFLKKILTDNKKLNPNKINDLEKIIKNILKVMGLKVSKKLFKKLLSPADFK